MKTNRQQIFHFLLDPLELMRLLDNRFSQILRLGLDSGGEFGMALRVLVRHQGPFGGMDCSVGFFEDHPGLLGHDFVKGLEGLFQFGCCPSQG